jgi:hypothetical protein
MGCCANGGGGGDDDIDGDDDWVTGIFEWLNPSCRIVALGSN